MKQFNVKITVRALADMEAIYDYIVDKLMAPDSAMKQYGSIAEAIESLNHFPERCNLLDSEQECSLGMRKLLVDHYAVIYVVEDNRVTVLRVFYNASDINVHLRKN